MTLEERRRQTPTPEHQHQWPQSKEGYEAGLASVVELDGGGNFVRECGVS